LPGRLSDVVGSKIYDNVVLNFPEQNDDELSWKPVGELSQTAKLYQVTFLGKCKKRLRCPDTLQLLGSARSFDVTECT